ncbi:MAG: hypothetical protein QXW07_02500 [Candidatus Woesearchaeota archaeon]
MGVDYAKIEQRILDEALPGAETLESLINAAYYKILDSDKLHYKEHAFEDVHKDKLVNEIISRLKEFFLEKNPHYKTMDKALFDETFDKYIMKSVFGITPSELREQFMDVKRITHQHISQIASSISRNYYSHMVHSAFSDIKSLSDIKGAFDYLKNSYKSLGINPPDFEKKIAESPNKLPMDIVKQHYLEVASQKYENKLKQKYS